MTVTESPKKVAIYARVSTRNHGQDVGLQVDELRRVAAARGWRIVGEYLDEGVSGTKETRPALDRLMTDVRAGKVGVVAVWRFDRFARSPQHLLAALDEFRRLDVDFISIRESVDTSSSIGKLIYTFLAGLAAFERELICERVQAGVDRARLQGKRLGRPRHEMDLRPALALLREGRGVKQVAAIMGVPRGTLRRRLIETGQLPGLGGVPDGDHNPGADGDVGSAAVR